MLRICGYTERRSTWYRYRLNTRSATYSLWPSNVQRNLISILTLLKHVDDAVESSRGYIHRNNWKGGKASGRLEKRDGWRLKTCGVCFWFVDRWDGRRHIAWNVLSCGVCYLSESKSFLMSCWTSILVAFKMKMVNSLFHRHDDRMCTWLGKILFVDRCNLNLLLLLLFKYAIKRDE